MGLNDFDALFVNSNGKCCKGIITSKNNTSVKIYKDWIYVNDPSMFSPRYGWENNCVLKIDHGNVNIADFHIIAVRSTNGKAVFVIAITHNNTKWMAGIGCNGYEDNKQKIANFFGVDLNKYEQVYVLPDFAGEPTTLECLRKIITKKGVGMIKEVYKTQLYEGSELYSKYVGVTQELLDEFLMWLSTVKTFINEEQYAEWLNKIKNKTLLRYNQGDGYLIKDEDELKNSKIVTPAGKINTSITN